MFKSNRNPQFRSKFSEDIFYTKYSHEGAETFHELACTLVEDVCQNNLSKDEKESLIDHISNLRFLPGGRYLYYAGREKKFFNNCYLLKAEEDTREDWANLSWKSESCLMTGGGIGVDYSTYRPEGQTLKGTGGISSGPIPKMQMINSIGQKVMQGGSRRSAIYASLNWKHDDIDKFLIAKNWFDMPVGKTDEVGSPLPGMSYGDIKQQDFNFPAPLDMTNISVNYDTEWLLNYWEKGDLGHVFRTNIHQALRTGEPGFSFNFFEKENETLRNACTEVTSEDDSDVCNLGSLNFARIDDLNQLQEVVQLSTKFLLCGTLRATLPYEKVYEIRNSNRRLGLGLMGLHEWLIQRGHKYETTPELHRWFKVYEAESDKVARSFSNTLNISMPVAVRAVAPTGTIGILGGTSTGVEPIFAVAYKRRYLKNKRWHYQYVVDSAAQEMIELYDVNPESIESALDLVTNYERRLNFQANVQEYVDMAISSTINLPAWDTEDNNEGKVEDFSQTLAKYAHRLRGFTCYPDGCRGGQPLTKIPYSEAIEKLGEEFEDNVQPHDICEITGSGGTCGV
jgi:ribonucleoside-diphosphate reductase alpha chain